jgi:uncharacterized protein (DUF58 family)
MKRAAIFPRPTGLWLIFGPVLGCMWMAAVNYANNLVYAVLYLIASLSFISIFHTWRNLRDLEIEHVRVHPAFGGGDVCIEVHLRNPGRRAIYSLVFARVAERTEPGRRRIRPLPRRGGGVLRIAAGDSRTVELLFPAGPRGLHHFEALLVRSSFPFGLFSAGWRVPIAADYYVYPQPKGVAAWPALQTSGGNGAQLHTQPGDDFGGVRAYIPGESLRHVDWKAHARGRPLSVKQFTGGANRELWLDAADLARLPLEERLSQLAFWVVNAEKEEIAFSLRLGRTFLPTASGPTHARQALEALAVAK